MDKVQKIREELVRLKKETSIGLSEHENGVEQGRMEIINALSIFIDSMQKEPVSEDLEESSIQFATDAETGNVDVVKQSSFFWGAIYHKQQMMAKAVDVTIAIPYPNGDGGYTQLVDSKEALPFGDNIKVLVIKED